MTPQQVIDHYGTVASAARAINIKGPSFYGWMKDGRIPIDRQCQYEVVSGGKLIADRNELSVAGPQAEAAA